MEFYDNDERSGKIPTYNNRIFTIKLNIKATRKVHDCGMCDEEIPRGSTVSRWSGRDDREFYSFYVCKRCLEELDEDD
jgi:hypothetical protein